MSSRAWSNVPIGFIAGAGLLLTAGPVAAQVQGETLTVQARIGELCTVTSASLDFGQDIDLEAANGTNASGVIDISCAGSTSLSVQLDGGLNFNQLAGMRAMSGQGNSIMYSLYKDANRATPWSPGETMAAPIDGEGSVPVFGTVPQQTNGHQPGLYTDEVTITLIF